MQALPQTPLPPELICMRDYLQATVPPGDRDALFLALNNLHFITMEMFAMNFSPDILWELTAINCEHVLEQVRHYQAHERLH